MPYNKKFCRRSQKTMSWNIGKTLQKQQLVGFPELSNLLPTKRTKLMLLKSKIFPATTSLSYGTLLRVIMMAVTEKKELKSDDESKTEAHFGIFGL